MSLPALLDPGAVARGAALLDVAASPNPYFSPSHALLLYLWIPAVMVSSLVLVMAPGLLLVFAAGAVRSAAEWLLLALATSVVALSVTVEAAEAVTGGPLRGSGFALAALGTAAAAALAAFKLARPGRTLRLTRPDTHTIAAAVSGAVVLFVALAPKFLWEVFNGDGAHAYESARMLLHRAGPFWSPEAGAMSTYPGVTSFLMSYPTAWFIRLFGELEVSARIPLLLFTSAGLYAGLLALVEVGRDALADTQTRWLLWMGIAVFTVVGSYSATYNQYHADIALPAAQDALVITWFLGFVWAFATGRAGWIVAFAGLTFATSPAGQVLLGLWVLAAAVFIRPFPLRALIVASAAIAGWFLVAKVSPAVLAALGQQIPGSEHSTGSLAKRLFRVQWRDWRRVVYVIVPGGILPAFSLWLLWRQDRVARAMTAVAAAHFAFFYVQSRVSLHYFAPAMLLPLAVYWRTVPALWRGRGLAVATTAAAALALWLSLPANKGPHLAARPVGGGIDDRLPGYDVSVSAAIGRSELLTRLIPTDANHAVPDDSYGGSPLAWNYYAHRTPSPRTIAYRLQGASDAPPPGARLAAAKNGVALYVVDEAAWARDLALRPPSTIARIYRISKQTLFRGS